MLFVYQFAFGDNAADAANEKKKRDLISFRKSFFTANYNNNNGKGKAAEMLTIEIASLSVNNLLLKTFVTKVGL